MQCAIVPFTAVHFAKATLLRICNTLAQEEEQYLLTSGQTAGELLSPRSYHCWLAKLICSFMGLTVKVILLVLEHKTANV